MSCLEPPMYHFIVECSRFCKSGISHKTPRHSNLRCAISHMFFLTTALCILCCNNKEYTHAHTSYVKLTLESHGGEER